MCIAQTSYRVYMHKPANSLYSNCDTCEIWKDMLRGYMYSLELFSIIQLFFLWDPLSSSYFGDFELKKSQLHNT